MADRVYEFLYRGFIPEENRGDEYSVVLVLDDKYVGPLTPQQADARGWSLSRIVADLNNAAMVELSAVKVDNAALRQTIVEKDERHSGEIEELRNAATSVAQSAVVAIDGANSVLQQMASKLRPSDLDDMRAAIDKLNAKITAPVEPANAGKI